MLTNSDRTVLYGVMAFIAYQVWKSRQCACGQTGGAAGCVSPSGEELPGSIPGWVQQLSKVNGVDYFTPRCGVWGRCS